jgi:hypothetical protein
MRLSTEQLVAAYEQAGKKEQKLVRDLKREGSRDEVERVLELLHYFPGSVVTATQRR